MLTPADQTMTAPADQTMTEPADRTPYAAVAVRQQLDVQAVHAKALEKLETLAGKQLEPKHASLFFEDVMKKEGTSQQQVGKCMTCDLSVSSTGSYKFQSHILACPLMPAAVK